MKTRYLSIVVILLLSLHGNAMANLIWDSGHHVYSEGTETFVNMYNDASAEITGGVIHEFYMHNETTAEITGGYISILWGQDTSHVDVYSGSQIDLLRPNDFSTAYVHGGTMNYLFALGSSNTNIYGGLLDEIQAKDSSILNFYVESYEWDPTGGDRNGGLLSGIWLDGGNSFSIDLVTEGTIDHINFVPEPGTIILFSMVGFALRHKTRKTII